MTALNRGPQNTNLAQSTKYLLTIDRIPTTQYFCQSANIPGVGLTQASFNTPFVDIPVMGNKLLYNPFNIKFLVDEPMDSWKQLYDWFLAISAPSGFDERNYITALQNKSIIDKKSLPNYSDITLTVLNALNNPVLRIQFINAFPTSLTDINLDTTLSADTIITADASFSYEYFNIIEL